jgi:hypothetical protein
MLRMPETVFVYDLEIIKAIPSGDRIPGIEYCGGWTDYAGMGISVLSYVVLELDQNGFIGEIPEPDYVLGDSFGRIAQKTFPLTDHVVGFNSLNFDDKVTSACGRGITTTYDLVEEIRLAASNGRSRKRTPKGFSYKLGFIGENNGVLKTEDGAMAPILWQRGERQRVIDYCRQDVFATARLLQLGLSGRLLDPNTGQYLKLRPLTEDGPDDDPSEAVEGEIQVVSSTGKTLRDPCSHSKVPGLDADYCPACDIFWVNQRIRDTMVPPPVKKSKPKVDQVVAGQLKTKRVA